jgi:hypothetical protein
VAPTLVHHYVTRHRYLPPPEFVEAVLAGPTPGPRGAAFPGGNDIDSVGTVSGEEAVRVAAEYLRNVYRDEEYTFVMQPERSVEYRTAWAVNFDTQEHLDTGDMTKAPLIRVLAVPKDGSPPYFPPSAWSVSEFEARLEGER